MKAKLLSGILLACGSLSFAQSGDPVVMTINGKPVLRSEFEYSYNKNNTEDAAERKSVGEYVDLFINYKLKVEAAKEAGLDTMTSFRDEFSGYRDRQIRPAMISDADVEAEARRIYAKTQQQVDNNGGMVHVAHILIGVRQQGTAEEEKWARERIDSVYDALKKGADFAALAKKVSTDPGSASRGGELPLIVKGQTLKEFEDRAWSLGDGEMSRPFLTAAGWHIILKKGHQNFYDYASQREAIINYIDQRGIREQIIDGKLNEMARQEQTTTARLLENRRAELEAEDPRVKYLIQEYHDGLLVYEICNRTVWEKAQHDEAGLKAYFRKNKKNYKWDEPRFKGIAYHTRRKGDLKAVKKAVKRLPFKDWAETLRRTFNADSIKRIRVEAGIFKKGDNALTDRMGFGAGTAVPPVRDYPYTGVYGKKLKAPKELDDVRALVVTDYQEHLERQWVEQLRKKYRVSVNEDVLKTVNNHE